ncbi:MAG: STAS domain-containing protein [Planctomycetota bacterium]|jgi:anti-sigma B factor antagonist
MVANDRINIEMASEGNIGVITFKAPNLSNSDEIARMSEDICEFIDCHEPEKVIVDFGEVSFFSSQVLGVLLNIRSRLQPFEGEVVLSAINPQLNRVFKITNLDQVFRFFPDKLSALKALGTFEKDK